MADVEQSRLAIEGDARISRSGWVDAAKGIAIALVVYNHVCMGLWTAGIPFWPHPSSEFATILSQVRMPLFFFLSGLFIERSARKPAAGFVARKLKTLMYPYFLWYLIQSGFLAAFAPLANSHPSPGNLLAEMFYRPYGQFWFLSALFVCDIIYLILNRLGAGRIAILAIGAALCAGATAIVHFASTGAIAFWLRPLQTFVYLSLGLVSAPYLLRWASSFPTSACLGVIASSFVALIGVAKAFPRQGSTLLPWDKIPWGYPALASPLGMLLIITLSVVLVRRGWGRPLIFLGSISLEIFVAHILGTAGTRIVLTRFLVSRHMILHLVAGTVGGLAVPMLLAWAARRYRLPFLFRLVERQTSERRTAKATESPVPGLV